MAEVDGGVVDGPLGVGREVETDVGCARCDPKVGELEAQRPAIVDEVAVPRASCPVIVAVVRVVMVGLP
jgi:hypothetical protein